MYVCTCMYMNAMNEQGKKEWNGMEYDIFYAKEKCTETREIIQSCIGMIHKHEVLSVNERENDHMIEAYDLN